MEYRSYRAPRKHGETFFDPSRERCLDVIVENRRSLADRLRRGTGRLTRLVVEARRDLARRAREYSGRYLTSPDFHTPGDEACPSIVLSGHQPRLFHPGVWFKNFVLSHLARETDSLAINLIVDNDLCGPPSIRVPAGSPEQPQVVSVDFDRSVGEIPFEERPILDDACWQSFGDRTLQTLNQWNLHPLLAEWWPEVVRISRQERNLGLCLARARHELEWRWGARTLELPISHLSDSASFRWFVFELLSDLPNFQRIYNQCLRNYRRAHRLRSHSHPVPELDRRENWLETPFWVWRRGQPQRRRLFTRQGRAACELSDLQGWAMTLPPIDSGNGESWVAALAEQTAAEIRIRPRALTTTLYARLVLCDGFIHGIGGGKYDQLTDMIASEWLGETPPGFLVATATAQLPLPRPDVTEEQVMATRVALRDLRFNPDRFLRQTGRLSPLCIEKIKWCEQTAGVDLAERHRALQRINEALAPLVAERRQELEQQLAQEQILARDTKLLGSREFAFCLFPPDTLRRLLLDNAG